MFFSQLKKALLNDNQYYKYFIYINIQNIHFFPQCISFYTQVRNSIHLHLHHNTNNVG